ncbi:MAG: HAD-IIB family hydrolase [Deltaproteobacteria bacterium]|nr:HAD-IIB family hydrolase [Deltaproteobacteria bacterium]
MPPEVCRRIRAIYTDIDDTITTDGRVPAAAYAALWRAFEAKLRVVLVTGRPAGWCDHLARMWPVSAVVGENGALCYAMVEGKLERLYAERQGDAVERLAAIEADVLAAVPEACVASDQPFRLYDLAIDFAEEVGPLPEADIDRIVEAYERHGAVAKVSSIHVNGWFGRFDKLSMCQRASEAFFGGPLDVEHATYIGDSPNDVPMFAHFPHACGVANVQKMAHRMDALPSYLADQEGGAGFAQIVDHILDARRG